MQPNILNPPCYSNLAVKFQLKTIALHLYSNKMLNKVV